jgi:predicted nucleic-acid-binding protein
MISVDTNVLARVYVDDPEDPQASLQRAAATRIMREGAVFVPTTVALELEWILRAFYGFDHLNVARVFRHLLDLPNVQVQDWNLIDHAVEAHLGGLDFADALHLASSRHCHRFASFDRKMARVATRLKLNPAVSAPRVEARAPRPR